MSGLRLADMDSTDMIDVLHYYFEEDIAASSGEQMEARSESRSVIYRTLYGTQYKYAMSTSDKKYNSDGSKLPDDGFYNDLEPFDPSENVVKPYVSPTELDEDSYLPFGKTLDAPLG